MEDEKTKLGDERTTIESSLPATGDTSAAQGEQIGPYRLTTRIGQGGMGEVWLAEQLEPVRRKVAFKLIKRGMDTERVVARFEAERQALALMDHPAVAKVLDGGSTPRGRPYFVMEYVPGEPITRHCDRHRLTVRQRLELFQLVCQGVQHAHQKALIHRDLKPSNVLIALQDGKPVPRIIDFGVAKATGEKLTDHTVQTLLGAMVGTPEYMSPEQTGVGGDDVDTRSDVYSLGVMLYELLCGRLPFEPEELRSEGYEGMRRRICEQDPARPSAHVDPRSGAAAARAEARGTDPATLRRTLAHDLDWIPMKALEKDRARRYDSPAALAEEIQRYLDDRPIVARPPSVAYGARKFVRRHRFGVTVAAALAVALVAGTVGTTVGFVRARLEASKARGVTSFLTGVLNQANPDQDQGRELTIREALDLAAQGVEESFRDQPDVEAEVRDTISIVYHEMGRFAEAEPHVRRAIELHERELGPNHHRTLAARGTLARTMMETGRYAEAQAEFELLLPTFRAAFGSDVPTLDLTQNLAALYLRQERYADAEPLLLDVIERRRRVLGPKDARYLASLNNLATCYVKTGRLAKAEPLYVEARRVRSTTLGNRHPKTLISVYNLGDLYRLTGRHAEAEPLIREALAGFREVVGPNHPYTLATLDGLARNLAGLGRWKEAEAVALENHALREQRFGAEHGETASAAGLLAEIRERDPRTARAH